MKSRNFPAGERGRFDADARRSPTLPSRYYHDADIHRQELDKVFHRNWCYVGHASQIPHPGDYCVDRIADQCIFLVRDQEAKPRAFFNVCQHRGHALLEAKGTCKSHIVCPYHAWTYGLDGRLIRAPHTEGLRDFDADQFGLKPVAVAECAGLLFANLDAAASDFGEEYPGLEHTLVDSLPAVGDFSTACQLDYDIAANWKVVVDNFSEGYHIPVAHKQLSQVLDSGSGQCARLEKRFAFFRSRSKAGYEDLELEPGSPYLSWTLWPNTCILSLPGCANLFVIRMAPHGPRRCLERIDLLTVRGEQPPPLDALKSLFADSFNLEDIAIVESVQRGLESLSYDQGRYVVDDTDSWYSESGLHRFHHSLLEALGG